jgi:hypothetical protein
MPADLNTDFPQPDFRDPTVPHPPKEPLSVCDRLKPRYPDLSDSGCGSLRRIYALVNDPARRVPGGHLADISALRRYLGRCPPEQAAAALKVVALSAAAAEDIAHANRRHARSAASSIQLAGLSLLRHRLGAGPSGLPGRLARLVRRHPVARLCASDVRDILINWLHSLPYLSVTLGAARLRENLQAIADVMLGEAPSLCVMQQQDVVEKMLLVGHRVPHAFEFANAWIGYHLSPASDNEFGPRWTLLATYLSQLADVPPTLHVAALKFVCDIAPHTGEREKQVLCARLAEAEPHVAPRARTTFAAARTALQCHALC